jgi:uncharacterized membrane protein
MRTSRKVLSVSLLALSVLFLFWFRDSSLRVAAMMFFTLPPLLLLAGVLRGSAKAAFWAGVFGLFWFCHGVMEAYALPAVRAYALAEAILAVVVILASCWPGMRARFGRKNTAADA